MLYASNSRHLSEPNFKRLYIIPGHMWGFFCFFFPPLKKKWKWETASVPAVSFHSACGPVGLRAVPRSQWDNNDVEREVEQRDIKQVAELEKKGGALGSSGRRLVLSFCRCLCRAAIVHCMMHEHVWEHWYFLVIYCSGAWGGQSVERSEASNLGTDINRINCHCHLLVPLPSPSNFLFYALPKIDTLKTVSSALTTAVSSVVPLLSHACRIIIIIMLRAIIISFCIYKYLLLLTYLLLDIIVVKINTEDGYLIFDYLKRARQVDMLFRRSYGSVGTGNMLACWH